LRVDDGAAEKIAGGAADAEKSRRDQPAGRGFGDRDGLAPFLEQGRDPLRPPHQIAEIRFFRHSHLRLAIPKRWDEDPTAFAAVRLPSSDTIRHPGATGGPN